MDLPFLSAGSGHFVHWSLCPVGSGECSLSGGILHAASLSFPGASLCQGFKNTLELPRSALILGSHQCCTQLKTSMVEERALLHVDTNYRMYHQEKLLSSQTSQCL